MQQLDDIRARVDVMAADRDLNVRAQGIRTVTVTEKVSSGRRGKSPASQGGL